MLAMGIKDLFIVGPIGIAFVYVAGLWIDLFLAPPKGKPRTKILKNGITGFVKGYTLTWLGIFAVCAIIWQLTVGF